MIEPELPPSVILSKFTDWQLRLNDRFDYFRTYDAMWRSKYMTEVLGLELGRFRRETTDGDHHVEVNSIYPFVTAYVASMYDSHLAFTVRRGTDLSGNAKHAEMVLEKWRSSTKVGFSVAQQDIDRLATMYDGAGGIVIMDESKSDLLSRVKLLVVPWWELFPDVEVTNVSEQRFVGRHYWLPLPRARRLFHDANVKGVQRPVDSFSLGRGRSQNDKERYVRVLEVFNMVDPYYTHESIPASGLPNPDFRITEESPSERGRHEFYVISPKDPPAPRLVYPLPYRSTTNDPLTPLPILTYLSEVGYPLDGISQLDRVLDPMRERMMLRSKRATNVRNQVPQAMAPKGMFDDTAKSQFRAGQHAILEYDEKFIQEGRSAVSMVGPLPAQNVVYDNTLYEQEISRDMDRSTLQAPADRAQISGGSATEVLQAAETSKSEMALLVDRKKEFLVQLAHSVLAAIRASLQRAGAGTVLRIVEGVGEDERVTEITYDDLNGDFEIEVVSGEPTKLAEERELRRQLDLTGVLDPLMARVIKGDKVAAALLDEIVRKANLPKRFLSESVIAMTTIEDATPVPRGAGGVGEMMGQGSRPNLPMAGEEEVTAGGPQPETDQPVDTETGVMQNGV